MAGNSNPNKSENVENFVADFSSLSSRTLAALQNSFKDLGLPKYIHVTNLFVTAGVFSDSVVYNNFPNGLSYTWSNVTAGLLINFGSVNFNLANDGAGLILFQNPYNTLNDSIAIVSVGSDNESNIDFSQVDFTPLPLPQLFNPFVFLFWEK